MKFTDIYFNYKEKYNDYIIIYPVGTFYNVLGTDTSIISNFMGYKIKRHLDIPKVGFPIVSLEKVIKNLEKNKINFILLERVNGIINIKQKKRFKDNQYNYYLDKFQLNNNKLDRLNKLFDYISKNYDNEKIQRIISGLEKNYE